MQIAENQFRALWAAVLKQAVDDIWDPKADKPHLRDVIRRRGIAWVQTHRDDETSFDAVCEYLDIDAAQTRQAILDGAKT